MRKILLAIPIDWISIDQAIHKIATFIVSGKPHQITTVNPEFVVTSRIDADFKTVLQQSDVSLPDGSGIIIGQVLNDKKPGPNPLKRAGYFFAIGFQYLLAPQSFAYARVTGVDLSEHIMRQAAEKGWRIYLLGGLPGVAQTAAQVWTHRYAGLSIIGTSAADPNDPSIVSEIKAAKPDILLVAYGAPKQDLFIAKHKDALNVPVMIGIGGTFDTLIGTKYNPPRWVKIIGLEWLAYLIRYPSRFKRIWRATVGFFLLTVTNTN